MQPPDGELVLAQVHCHMPHAPGGVRHAQALFHRSIRLHFNPHPFEDELRLVAESAAAEEPPEIPLPRRELPAHLGGARLE